MSKNLVANDTPRDFFVWVHPEDKIARHNIREVGSFQSVDRIIAARSTDALPFIHNPEFKGAVAPFTRNRLHDYVVEYNLEMARSYWFPDYPSRLQAVFLFPSEEEATAYSERHRWHVGERILKAARSKGPYVLSTHDLSWIDYLRGSILADSLGRDCCRSYWSGESAYDYQLFSMGDPWPQHEPIQEVLFLGTVEFTDRSFPGEGGK